MSAKAFWIFKWRGGGSNRCGVGDFEKVLTRSRGFRAAGFESPWSSSLWKKMHAGDIVFCYQSERRDVLGVAKIIRRGFKKDGSQHIDLQPLRYFHKPVDIQTQRKELPRLRALKCLQRRATRAVQRVTSREARMLAESCRIKTLIPRPRKRRAAGAESKGIPPQFVPVPSPPEYDRSASSWATEILEEYGLGRALEIARIELHKAQPGASSRQLWEEVCEQLRQRGCPSRPATARAIIGTQSVARETPNNSGHRVAANPDELELRAESNTATVENIGAKEIRRGWTTCPSCGCDLKTENLLRHGRRVHNLSQNTEASVRQPLARTAKAKLKRKARRPRGSKRLDLSVFPQLRSRAFGSGQSRKSGSHRDNRGHR